MVLLYKDPNGETVTTVTQSVIPTTTPAQKKSLTLNNKEWEVKMSTLERNMKDKDKRIAELLEIVQNLGGTVSLHYWNAV